MLRITERRINVAHPQIEIELAVKSDFWLKVWYFVGLAKGKISCHSAPSSVRMGRYGDPSKFDIM